MATKLKDLLGLGDDVATPAPGGASSYTVQPGDSGTGIMKKLGYCTVNKNLASEWAVCYGQWQLVANANNITNLDQLQAGTVLTLPSNTIDAPPASIADMLADAAKFTALAQGVQTGPSVLDQSIATLPLPTAPPPSSNNGAMALMVIAAGVGLAFLLKDA